MAYVPTGRVCLILSGPLLCGPRFGRSLVAFPQPELGLGPTECGGTSPPHGVRNQAESAFTPTGPTGRLLAGGQGGGPLLLLPLPGQWAV